jgi:hypothetical protein
MMTTHLLKRVTCHYHEAKLIRPSQRSEPKALREDMVRLLRVRWPERHPELDHHPPTAGASRPLLGQDRLPEQTRQLGTCPSCDVDSQILLFFLQLAQAVNAHRIPALERAGAFIARVPGVQPAKKVVTALQPNWAVGAPRKMLDGAVRAVGGYDRRGLDSAEDARRTTQPDPRDIIHPRLPTGS